MAKMCIRDRTYAELTAAMPQCGGEHVFSYKAMGSTGSFICTWMIIPVSYTHLDVYKRQGGYVPWV